MANTEPLVIDTREQTETHTLKLITSDNPDGIVFTVQPMGAGTYLKFMDKVKTLQALNTNSMNAKQLLKLQNDLCNMLIPLVTPTDDFKNWAKLAEEKYPLAYQAVMRQIMRFVFGKTYF